MSALIQEASPLEEGIPLEDLPAPTPSGSRVPAVIAEPKEVESDIT